VFECACVDAGRGKPRPYKGIRKLTADKLQQTSDYGFTEKSDSGASAGSFRLWLGVGCSCDWTSFASEYSECVEGGDDCFSLGVVYGDADDALPDGVLCGGYAERECVGICFKNRVLVKLHPFVIFHHRLLPHLRRIRANTAR